MMGIIKWCNSHISLSKNTLRRIDSRTQLEMSPAITSFLSPHTRSWPRPAWAFYSVSTIMLTRILPRISPSPSMRPNIGLTMRSSRTSHHPYGMRWSISLMRTNHTLQHGTKCTILTEDGSHSTPYVVEDPFTTPPCVDSMTLQNTSLSNI